LLHRWSIANEIYLVVTIDQYFPSDLDFSAYFNNDAASFDEGAYNEDMDYLLNMGDNNQNPGNSGTAGQSGSIPVKQEVSSSATSSGDVIMIPPMITHQRVTDMKIKRESDTSKAAIKGVVAMSKFSKTSKPLPLLPASKYLSNRDVSDDDSDDDRGKRLKYDPSDPQRNERR
jgi:hypothetical protein